MQSRDPLSREALARLPVDERIDEICDGFEREWRQGNRPDLLSFLNYCPPGERPRLFTELVLVEWELRSRNGEVPSWEEYLSRYPGYVVPIEAARFKMSSSQSAGTDCVAVDDDRRAARRIAQFELVELIGSGAAGDVWKAVDGRLQRTVAIKIPRAAQLSEPELDRFLREGRAAAQLRHPAIVAVHEVGRDGYTPYIVCDYIQGKDLRTWFQQSQPTPRQAAELCRQIAEALHYAHESGIVHRDLKPGNVLIDETDRPFVTDFGLAKWVDDQREMTLEGELLGTPAYMSPEQALGQAARADRRTDVYALGVLLYEMLTGRCPFEGSTATVTYKIIHEDPVRPRALDRTIPRDLETICLKAMAKEPAKRYSSAQEMAVDLRRFLRGEPIIARRPGVLERCWKWTRRHPAIAAAGLLAVIAIAAIAMASRLASENWELLGLRIVTLTTEPAGAQVLFVPLDVTTGEPIPQRKIKARGVSPVREELKPGAYLVVVWLDDGRFHEVYRYVPRGTAEIPGPYKFQRWQENEDGTVSLPVVELPAAAVTDGMAYIESETEGVEPFYMQCLEFTVNDYQRVLGYKRPPDRRSAHVAGDHAVTLSFAEACMIAEKCGLRLPYESEIEHALTHIQERRQNGFDEKGALEIGPVGEWRGDATNTLPQIVGLLSNVAEWTMSRAEGLRATAQPDTATASNYRIVRGSNLLVLSNSHRAKEAGRNLDRRMAIPEYEIKPWLGFRCVRGARPRFVDIVR